MRKKRSTRSKEDMGEYKTACENCDIGSPSVRKLKILKSHMVYRLLVLFNKNEFQILFTKVQYAIKKKTTSSFRK